MHNRNHRKILPRQLTQFFSLNKTDNKHRDGWLVHRAK